MTEALARAHGLLLAHQQALPLLLTLGAYAAGVALQRMGGHHPLLNPTLLAVILVVGMLRLMRIDYHAYFAAAQPVHLLLGPAVVALAIPLYRHLGLIREHAFLVASALVVGSLSAIVSGVIVGWCMGATRQDLLSLAPKSATTAVSMAVSAEIGGQPAVTAVLTILTGICGAVFAGSILNALRIHDPAARGFSMGLASHGIATARAFQESETAGAFAGLAMGLNAVTTATLAPLVIPFLVH